MRLYQLFAKHIAGSKLKPPYNGHHLDRLDELLYKLPTGSGIDAGSTIAFEECKRDKIVFNSAFHVLDSNGYYDGWIEFKVIVRPSFTGFDLEIKPLQRKTYFNDYLHDYVFDVFRYALDSEIEDKMVKVNDHMVDFDAAVQLMDDEIRQELHQELVPCTNQEFINAYIQRHRERFGEEFTIN